MEDRVKINSTSYMIFDANGLLVIEVDKDQIVSSQIDYSSIIDVDNNHITYYDNYWKSDGSDNDDVYEIKFDLSLQPEVKDYIFTLSKIGIAKKRFNQLSPILYITSLNSTHRARHFVFYKDYFREICYSRTKKDFEIYSFEKFSYDNITSFDKKSFVFSGVEKTAYRYVFKDGKFEVLLDLLNHLL